MVEQLGSGMSRILKSYDRTIFDISDNFFVVTFKFEKAAIKSGDKKTSKKYEYQKLLIVEYLSEHGSAKSEEISNILNLQSTRTKVILSKMAEEKIISFDGANRNRTYKLIR